jgi:hypothetical protein
MAATWSLPDCGWWRWWDCFWFFLRPQGGPGLPYFQSNYPWVWERSCIPPSPPPPLCLCPITTEGLLLLHPPPPFVFLPTKTLDCPKYSPIKLFIRAGMVDRLPLPAKPLSDQLCQGHWEGVKQSEGTNIEHGRIYLWNVKYSGVCVGELTSNVWKIPLSCQ